MASWLPVQDDSDFPLGNLPYGVFSTDGSNPRIGVAIGDSVLDLKVLAEEKVFADLKFDATTLAGSTLNAYASLGRGVHGEVRRRLQQLLEKDTKLGDVLRDNKSRREKALVPLSSVKMHMPMNIGDYTDFFVGLHHAENCAKVVNPEAKIQQMCPNFFNLPTGYTGRASSVVVSGTSFRRPNGQFAIDGKPAQSRCLKLDFEVEFAAFIAQGNEMGTPIDVNKAEDHIFGFVLMNDWSARDIQLYESSPLGPFNGKSFCTTVSPWIVPPEALEPFRIVPKETPRELVSYLRQEKKESAYDIPINAWIEADSERYHVAEANTHNVVFSFAQMIAHHTRNGCPLRTGDLLATGTLSGPTQQQLGCLLEMTMHGTKPYDMASASTPGKKLTRAYLEDGDTVEFTAQVRSKDGLWRVGFGKCTGKVLPAI